MNKDIKELEKELNLSEKQALIYAKELNLLYKKEKEKSKELEQALNKLKELQQELINTTKLATIGEFSAGVAHEIKGPLMAIIGYIDLISKHFPNDDEKYNKWLTIIRNEAYRISNIVASLLDFSRKQQPIFSKINVNEVIENTLLITEHTLSHYKNIEIIKELSDNLPEIDADANQLQQVFMNLMLNAAQAMKDEGKLWIRTEKRNNNVIISFTDTGCGIEEDKLTKIFEPFYTTKEKGLGTGLGLSICQSIIEKHNGKIKVKSEVNKGTTFDIILPLTIDKN